MNKFLIWFAILSAIALSGKARLTRPLCPKITSTETLSHREQSEIFDYIKFFRYEMAKKNVLVRNSIKIYF